MAANLCATQVLAPEVEQTLHDICQEAAYGEVSDSRTGVVGQGIVSSLRLLPVQAGEDHEAAVQVGGSSVDASDSR